MARTERIVASPFAQFMVSTAGRALRGAIGIVLIGVGYAIAGIAGWIVAAFGALLVLAGVFDFCFITGLIDGVWSGREARARGHLVAR